MFKNIKYGNQVNNFILNIICLVLIVLLFPSCFSHIPVTGGASNLKKGEFDLYIPVEMFKYIIDFNRSTVWDTNSSLYSFSSGFRYGISDVFNVEPLLWLDIYEIGFSPNIHFQLIDSNHRLRLCLKTYLSKRFNNKVAEFGIMPELIWGLNEYFFAGLRYEQHFIAKNNGNIIAMPVTGAFIGAEKGRKILQKIKPVLLIQFGLKEKNLILNCDWTFHLRINKKD